MWLCRFLNFWEELCKLRAAAGAETATFKEHLEAAYKESLLPFHGWVTQRAFEVAVQAAPEWSAVLPLFAPTEAEFRTDALSWCEAAHGLIARINATLDALGLRSSAKTA